MSSWTAAELDRIGRAVEFEVASRRPDGSLRPFVTIWGVRLGDDIYVRSAHGADNPWFVRAIASGDGQLRAGGVERDVAFELVQSGPDEGLRRAYHAKYDRYGPGPVGSVLTVEAERTTLRLVPR
ncbi:MAG TPA: DUF2255 family protein [Candidatus Limnocylindrales bacterium]|nr:DUF2255 family protein [Candidatus Limnocylindrales bacterium]